MKIFVGVTHPRWFDFLSNYPALDEVNFWQPGGKQLFKRLEPGDMFLFKLPWPENRIVGGGRFTHACLLPISRAWQIFGVKNGAATEEELKQRVGSLRGTHPQFGEDYVIGCVLLGEPFFLPREAWFSPPQDFRKNIVQGKTYLTDTQEGRDLFERLLEVRRHTPIPEPVMMDDRERYSERLVRQRLGQGTFRTLIAELYGQRCAVTGEKALPVLEAAHVKPYRTGGPHVVQNGILLRSDLHRLFDAGYVAITPSHRVLVSRRLKKDFNNGEPYYPYHNTQLRLPEDPQLKPGREFLDYQMRKFTEKETAAFGNRGVRA